MGKYSKGYIPDPVHKRTQKSSHLLLTASPSNPTAFTAEPLEGTILDQNQCGSCTGHGSSQALEVAFKFVNLPLGFRPSPGGIYTVTRCIERLIGSPLSDSGAMPSDIMTSLQKWGIRPMQAPSPQGFATDVDPSNVNDEPKLDDLETDALKIVTGEYRIDEQTPDTIDQMCAGLVACGALGIGVFVDTAFENWDPSQGPLTSVDLNDPNGGGHWLAVTSYSTNAAGKRVFRGPNSWTDSWGDKGHYEVTEDWLKQALSDCYVFHVGG